MNAHNVLLFGDQRLLPITGLTAADKSVAAAIARDEADGVYISQSAGYRAKDLEHLAMFDNLRVLVIVAAKGVDLSYIPEIASLRYLSIDDADLAVDLSALTGLKHLRLRIVKGRVLPEAGLKQLTDLAMWNHPAANLFAVTNYPSLKQLEVIQAKSLVNLDGLESCTKLKSIVLAYCPKLESIDALGGMRNLECVDLQNTKKLKSYGALARLTKLEKLLIDRSAPMPSVAPLASLKALRHLVVRNTSITDCSVAPLSHLPALSHIYMDDKKEYRPALRELTKTIAARAVSI